MSEKKNGACLLPTVYHIALHVPPGQCPQPCEVCLMFCISKGNQVACRSYRDTGRQRQRQSSHTSRPSAEVKGGPADHPHATSSKKGGKAFIDPFIGPSPQAGSKFLISLHRQMFLRHLPVQCILGIPHTVSTGSDMSFVGGFSLALT